jgi:hypothetical protein
MLYINFIAQLTSLLCKIHCLHFLFRARLAVSFVMYKEFKQDIKPYFNDQTTFADSKLIFYTSLVCLHNNVFDLNINGLINTSVF